MKKIANYIILSIPLVVVFFIIFSPKYPLELGKGYKININGNSLIDLEIKDNTIIILSHITRFNFDSIFIIVEQKPKDLILKHVSFEITSEERSKIFRNSTFKQYWIVDKTKPCNIIGFDSINQIHKLYNVYGPYTKEKFILKRKELGVSKELKLKKTSFLDFYND